MEMLRKTAVFRVDKQTEGMSPDKVASIALSGVPVMPELLTKFPNLTHLTFVSMKPLMKSIKELPLDSLTQLRVLELSDNAISLVGTAEEGEAPMPVSLPTVLSLRRLLLVNNNIASFAEVEVLAKAFPGLEVLDLEDNPLDLSERSAFDRVFALFPNLVALNSRDKAMEETVVAETEDDEEEDDDEEDSSAASSSDESSAVDDGSEDGRGNGGSDDAPDRKRPRA